MIDFHTHILPGIDDGSQSMEESIHMLHLEQQQGVDIVIATPHFYAHHDTVSQFLQRRAKAFEALNEKKQENQLELSILQGAEVYYFPGMGAAEQLRQLCVEGTSLLLLELPFVQWTDSIYADVKKIVEKQKLTVLLAHVERYYDFQKNKKIWDKMFELPLYAQLNTGNMEKRKKKKFLSFFIKTGVPVVLGSDCHNMNSRLPNIQKGTAFLESFFGAELLAEIDDRGKRLLSPDE